MLFLEVFLLLVDKLVLVFVVVVGVLLGLFLLLLDVVAVGVGLGLVERWMNGLGNWLILQLFQCSLNLGREYLYVPIEAGKDCSCNSQVLHRQQIRQA